MVKLMTNKQIDIMSVSAVFLGIGPFFIPFVFNYSIQFIEIFQSVDILDRGSFGHGESGSIRFFVLKTAEWWIMLG